MDLSALEIVQHGDACEKLLEPLYQIKPAKIFDVTVSWKLPDYVNVDGKPIRLLAS